MIAKGTPHRDGAVLARYLVTGKDREQAELWELRGFACTGIVAAFRSVHVMAAATKCMAPFFHVSIRNRDGERLDRYQWKFTADTIERILGLTDQPRAIAFHTARDTGHSHMHVAWSRIDLETLTAMPLSFFKQRLKVACRQLESKFGMRPVPNSRPSAIRFAPTRDEEEQARRLQVDVHATRETIRDCFERSDCGRSFRDALAQKDLLLARGDRRDFLVVGAGGMHALGKRILGVSAAEIRDRLADLSGDLLPNLEQARAMLTERNQGFPHLETVHPHVEISGQDKGADAKDSRRFRRSGNNRAAGKKQPRDRPRAELPGEQAVVPVDHIQTSLPAPRVSLEMEHAPTYQPGNEATEHASCERQVPEILPSVAHPEAQTSEPFSRADNAALEPVTKALSQPEAPRPAQKSLGLAARLRDQFRALVKQLTARDPAPRPTSGKRRRDDRGGAFKAAAALILRSVARVPPFHFVDPNWEAFTWLRLWGHNDPPCTDTYQEHSPSMSADHSPNL